jgi:Holliday junction resolvasome RuvABC endonuclease subunit
MKDEIYEKLVSSGRQDLANQYLVMKTEKDADDRRLEQLETVISEIKRIVVSKTPASSNIERIFILTRSL